MNKNNCITADCECDRYKRGLCAGCYRDAEAIANTNFDWAALERLGLVLPQQASCIAHPRGMFAKAVASSLSSAYKKHNIVFSSGIIQDAIDYGDMIFGYKKEEK